MINEKTVFKERPMKDLEKTVGIAVSTFGLGILLAFFLPDGVLAVMEAVVIATAGFIFIKH